MELIDRRDAIRIVDSIDTWQAGWRGDAIESLKALPSARPEITDEQAIAHLQSSGWMQQHDKEMYESGLRERLADDSGSYDSLIPCEDTTVCETDDTTGTTGDAWIIDEIKDFLGEKPSGLITGSRKEFRAWLERMRWHVQKCDELARELYTIKAKGSCEDAVSRTDVIDLYKHGAERIAKAKGMSVKELPHRGLDVLMNLPSVTPVRDCKGCRFKFLPERTEETEIAH